MNEFSGIDLHSNNSVVVVSDETDQIAYQRRHANDLAGILAVLEPYRVELAGVVVESTYNWYWLVNGLMETGYAVHLANTTAIKKYEGLKYSGDEADEADAAYLAKLLRLGLLPEDVLNRQNLCGAILQHRQISIYTVRKLYGAMWKFIS